MKPSAFTRAVAEMQARIVELEIRLANVVRHGRCTDVDAEKHLCRIEIGKDIDGTSQKSPWISYSQHAGAFSLHLVPTVGQNMTVYSPNGDFEQGKAIPLGWNDANPSPSTKADEVVATYLKQVKFTVSDGKLVVEVPDTMLKADDDHMVHLTKQDGLTVKGNALFVKGALQHAPDEETPARDISSDHKHLGVEPGLGMSGPPT